MSSSYRMELDRWLNNLDVRADRVLDIGGSQLPVKSRTKTWDVNEYFIADLPEPHVGSPKPDIELDLNHPSLQGFPREFNQDSNYTFNYPPNKATFNMIFCLEVFDYIWNPVVALSFISTLLEYGGTAWVTFPFVYPTHQPIEEDAFRYTEFGVHKLAEASGLDMAEVIRRRPETDAIEQLWRRERMRAAKNYDHDVTGWIVKFSK